jgi:hypothetical protein
MARVAKLTPKAIVDSHDILLQELGEPLDAPMPDTFPDTVDARFRAGLRTHRATALLLAGDLEAGFQQYEWRLGYTKEPHPDTPRWRGEDIAGKTLLIVSEQGFGDVIQFIRYAPLIAARGVKVIVAVLPALVRLLQSLPGVAGVTALDARGVYPHHDVHCMVLSLPHLCGTTLATVPNAVPYLAPPADAVARWRQRLAGPAFKVGVAWAGNPAHWNDRNRSMPLDALAPLAALEGVALYALQKGPRLADTLGFPGPIEPIGAEFDDFAETAAALLSLDLVVSVDSAVTHLAGALARVCVTLLPDAGEWRWLLERGDSPWYPTMVLLRQPTEGDWATPVRQLAASIAALVKQRSAAAGERP